MSEFMDVASTSDIGIGRMKAVAVGDRRIALYHTAEGFFATDNTCPHRGGPLAEGDLIDNEVTCPWHLWSFDVTSGKCAGNPEIEVATHELRVDGDRILVRLS
jgi:nitrite reductase (NADH) small subunit